MFNFDLRNETLNLVDDFILDHIDDFSEEELYWIIEEVEKLSRSFYRKFKDLIDEDIEALADEIEEED
jgi:hypothetical protein